ncbi:MAG: type II toxin-antitoxin system HicA family toxin [Chitinophagaceae bacterium]
MNSKDLLKQLRMHGWYDVKQKGSHLQLKHPTKKGKITVPMHGKKDIATGTLIQILKAAGLK